MAKTDVEDLLKLPAQERLEIAQILWESVEPEEEARLLLIPDWQREILKERVQDLDRNPGDEQSWEEVKAEIWPGA
jgi:putative addiction module component (TIGR02574 family)